MSCKQLSSIYYSSWLWVCFSSDFKILHKLLQLRLSSFLLSVIMRVLSRIA